MSDTLEKAAAILNEKMAGGFPAGSAKFAIDGTGAVIIDSDGARVSDEAADVTLTADEDTFHGIMSGDVNPTSAFMTGKLKVDGDMGLAMQLASLMA